MRQFETYYVDCGFDGFYMRIDTARSEAPISMYGGPDKPDEETQWESTQYQTADARHDVDRAAVLCVKVCGEDWYCEPGKRVTAESVIISVSEAA